MGFCPFKTQNRNLTLPPPSAPHTHTLAPHTTNLLLSTVTMESVDVADKAEKKVSPEEKVTYKLVRVGGDDMSVMTVPGEKELSDFAARFPFIAARFDK